MESLRERRKLCERCLFYNREYGECELEIDYISFSDHCHNFISCEGVGWCNSFPFM